MRKRDGSRFPEKSPSPYCGWVRFFIRMFAAVEIPGAWVTGVLQAGVIAVMGAGCALGLFMIVSELLKDGVTNQRNYPVVALGFVTFCAFSVVLGFEVGVIRFV